MQIATPTAWKDYIVPAIGLVGTLVTVIATWAKDLNASAQRIRTLDEATKRAAFWDTWSKAMAAADPEANRATFTSKVKNEVLAAADSVEKAFHVLAVQQAPMQMCFGNTSILWTPFLGRADGCCSIGRLAPRRGYPALFSTFTS